MSTSGPCRSGRATRAASLVLAALLAAMSARAGTAAGPAAIDYAAVFGGRYADAERFLGANEWMGPALALPPLETRIALAVVFPELVRFSTLEDAIQVRGLKVLYVRYGRAYSDFSVGRFQMKPSFAEQLESDSARLFDRDEREAIGVPAFEAGDTPTLREQRVRRLDDLEWQVRYLRLFMLVMQKRYPAVSRENPDQRLRFYATAYNTGYAAGEAAIRRRIGRRRFHVARFASPDTYDYADVALFAFRRQ